jgi:hypothetical protein
MNDDFEVDSWNGNQDDERQQMKNEQKAFSPQEEEDSDEAEVLKLCATHHLPQPEEDSSSEVKVLKMAPRRPRPQTQLNPSPRLHASPKKPTARTVPPSWKRKQPVVTAGVPTLSPKALNKMRPTVTTKKFKDSSFVAQSSSRNLWPRPHLFEKPQQSKPTMKHLRKERDVISIHSSDSDSEVILSPRARQRLAVFDAEVMKKKMQVIEKKRVKGVNGKREVSALKRSGSSGDSRTAPSTMRPPPRSNSQSSIKISQEGKLPPPSAAVKRNGKRNNVSAIIASPIPGPSFTTPLQALSRFSSSIFHPHLPPNPSLPDTIVKPSSSLESSPDFGAIEQFESPEKKHALFPKSRAESGRLTTKKISLQEIIARAESRRRVEL